MGRGSYLSGPLLLLLMWLPQPGAVLALLGLIEWALLESCGCREKAKHSARAVWGAAAKDANPRPLRTAPGSLLLLRAGTGRLCSLQHLGWLGQREFDLS